MTLNLPHDVLVPPLGHGRPLRGIHIKNIAAYQGKITTPDVDSHQGAMRIRAESGFDHLNQIRAQLDPLCRGQVHLGKQVLGPEVGAQVDMVKVLDSVEIRRPLTFEFDAVDSTHQAPAAPPSARDLQGIELLPIEADLVTKPLRNQERNGQCFQSGAQANIVGDEDLLHRPDPLLIGPAATLAPA